MSKITYLVMALAFVLGGYLVSGIVWAEHPPLDNADFETIDISKPGVIPGWETFTTPNGTLGPAQPRLVPFDTNGDETATTSAQFSVGQLVVEGVTPTLQGGGISQVVLLHEGTYNITVDIAASWGLPGAGLRTPGGPVRAAGGWDSGGEHRSRPN